MQIKMFTLALLATAGSAMASVSYSYNTTYSQDFDTLPTAAAPGAVVGGWVNNSTLPGWYSNQTALFRNSAGTDNNGAVYSYGTLPTTERALGSLGGGSGTAGTGTSFNGVTYAAAFVNSNVTTATDFTVTFDGEQWRNGGNTAVQSLVFSYQVFAAGTTPAAIAAALTGTGWTNVAALNFASLVGTSTAAALDGNLAANRTAGITATVPVTWAANEILVTRWVDANDLGNDHGLAIDNLRFSAVPTPGAAALLGMGGLLMARRRR
jgi:hypothetical protein